jgi:uncharacterized protein (DUF2267 family)
LALGKEGESSKEEESMSTTGLDVFDKSVQVTNTWLNEMMENLGPDRQLAWHVLGVVLRTLRDRLPADLSAHLGAQLPLIVRGAYYDAFQPSRLPQKMRTRDEFLGPIAEGNATVRPVSSEDAVKAVFSVLDHYLDPGQVRKVREALPEDIRALWPEPGTKH